jgi:hypothetical protein
VQSNSQKNEGNEAKIWKGNRSLRRSRSRGIGEKPYDDAKHVGEPNGNKEPTDSKGSKAVTRYSMRDLQETKRQRKISKLWSEPC